MQKSVLITGCSSGIGLESALELKASGILGTGGLPTKPTTIERMSGLALPVCYWI